MSLRILVADDHEIVRCGLCAILQAQVGWEVCGEASDGRSAVEKSRELRPDVLILDLSMPALNGLEATRQILKADPGARVLVLTQYDTDQVVREVLEAGARGYLLKTDASRELVVAVEALRHNKTYFTSRVAAMVLEGFLRGDATPGATLVKRDRLTPREREVVQLLVEGKSTKEVAVALDLSVKTAETHRANIMRKLELHSISELVMYAVGNNIVQVPGYSASD
jgi:DNA-binding NarL/FixJ family response regulator